MEIFHIQNRRIWIESDHFVVRRLGTWYFNAGVNPHIILPYPYPFKMRVIEVEGERLVASPSVMFRVLSGLKHGTSLYGICCTPCLYNNTNKNDSTIQGRSPSFILQLRFTLILEFYLQRIRMVRVFKWRLQLKIEDYNWTIHALIAQISFQIYVSSSVYKPFLLLPTEWLISSYLV